MDIRDLYCLSNVIALMDISRRTKCVGMWSGQGRDMFLFIVEKIEGTNHL